MKIGIIGAMETEVAHLISKMSQTRTVTVARMEFHEGSIGDTAVVVVRSGIGKVNAGCCVQILCDRFGVTHILNTGAAGSLNNSINIGDIVVSTDAMYHDVDSTIFGYAPGEVPQLGVKAFTADRALREQAVAACRAAAPDISVFEGRVVSGDQFISDRAVKARLAEVFSGDCCEMEGAAIAQAAYINGLPFVIIRAISDKADGSDQMDYPAFETAAAVHCSQLVEAMLISMKE